MSIHTDLFRTLVETPRWVKPIERGEGVVLLGSCFAQLMTERFSAYALPVFSNPLGVLYNPSSIALTVHHAVYPDLEEPPVFQVDGNWYCWWAGTSICRGTRDECTKEVRKQLRCLFRSLSDATWLFVTLGTNVCYRLHDSGQVVANCHHASSSMFREESLSIAKCMVELETMVKDVTSLNPNIHIVFTVSPFRYAKYGFHRSQLAKSTLLLAIDEISRSFPEQVSYFPAYEIVMDELRDYRFYADDMLHPSNLAADYIWKRLVAVAMSKRMQQYLLDYEPIRLAENHVPRNPNSEAYMRFMQQIAEKKRKIIENV